MEYYEVFVADSGYHSDKPLTYFAEEHVAIGSVVSIQLRGKTVTGFVHQKVGKPEFATKPIKNVLSTSRLPDHIIPSAKWLSEYYTVSFGEALRQFAPSKPMIKSVKNNPEQPLPIEPSENISYTKPLTKDQTTAIQKINSYSGHTVLLHGNTGTGKTRVYLELAKTNLDNNKSVLILTPEIALTSQLAHSIEEFLPDYKTIVLHSQQTASERKKKWFEILESKRPIIVLGPRSALFCPIHNLGLIIVDEAHEPAYKQEQAPRYQATRVASKLAELNDAKAILGSATPLINDFHLASAHNAVVEMSQMAAGDAHPVDYKIVDLRDRNNFVKNSNISDAMIEEIKATLANGQQAMIYLNRRGTARMIMCQNCGWQMLCPNCGVPLVYHGDDHQVRCHTCGYKKSPPIECPECKGSDIIYKSVGTKTLATDLQKLFPNNIVGRFDGDNTNDDAINARYKDIKNGKIDILIGTQLLAKGFDLPKLGMVGVIVAETSLFIPDYSAEERTFQLLYQVAGRVGRGHGKGTVVIQSYDPESIVLQSAIKKDWAGFYEHILKQRQDFRFPPYSFLLKLSCRRVNQKTAEKASNNLRDKILSMNLPVEVIGPNPSFFEKLGNNYNWQLVVKSKNRGDLVEIANSLPAKWTADLDPIDLL